MSAAVNSGGRFWPPNKNSPDVNWAIGRYPQLEELLVAIDRAITNLGWDSESPAAIANGSTFFRLLSETGSEWICNKLQRVRPSSLWFIVATYLEARREPRCWYELSDDHAQHIMWVLSMDERPNEDDLLSRRALILAYLMDREGWAPDWFRPLPEA